MDQGDLVRPQGAKVHFARRGAVFQSWAGQVVGVELTHYDVEYLGRRDLVLLARLGDEGGIGSDVLTHGRTEANNVLVFSSLVSTRSPQQLRLGISEYRGEDGMRRHWNTSRVPSSRGEVGGGGRRG